MKAPALYKTRKKTFITATVLAAILWIVVWQTCAVIVDKPLFLPYPVSVFMTFGRLMSKSYFWHSVLSSVINIIIGYVLGVLAGIVLAWVSYLNTGIEAVLALPIKIIRAVPVASFIILALLWLSSTYLSILISFLMVLPIIYTNVLTGLKNASEQLLEMAHCYNMSLRNKISYLYVPAAMPHLTSALSTGAGLAWKSGIAAEVIGITRNSIGNNLYQSKIYLETTELFAWTITVIIISLLFEKTISLIIKKLC